MPITIQHMKTGWRWLNRLSIIPAGIAVLLGTALAYPQPLFAYHIERGNLALYSDQPFDTAKAQSILANINSRIERSPLYSPDETHRIFVSNAPWRATLFFNASYGAAGVNYFPVTRNVFIRHSDIDANTTYGASGRAAAPPRTFEYYASHEITHSLTGEYEGVRHVWNWRLPQWVREGYADYVGLGGRGQVDITAYYKRFRANDPQFKEGSGFYDHYRMLAAYFLDKKGWSVPQLLQSRMSLQEAQAMMDADMAKHS